SARYKLGHCFISALKTLEFMVSKPGNSLIEFPASNATYACVIAPD
ncbi:MAG: hypothetical protein ACI9V1_003333, partial [Spirosomataceae bacterium]